MDTNTLLEYLKKNEIMTEEHFKAITGQEHCCKCNYCTSKAGPLICKNVEDLAYFHKCDFCPTVLYHSNKRVMPYPHWDVYLVSWPLGKNMSYHFCARCQNCAIIRCSDCNEKQKQLCNDCSEHLDHCGYRRGKFCFECSDLRNKN